MKHICIAAHCAPLCCCRVFQFLLVFIAGIVNNQRSLASWTSWVRARAGSGDRLTVIWQLLRRSTAEVENKRTVWKRRVWKGWVTLAEWTVTRAVRGCGKRTKRWWYDRLCTGLFSCCVTTERLIFVVLGRAFYSDSDSVHSCDLTTALL